MRRSKQTRREARQLLRLALQGGVLDQALVQELVGRVLREKPRGYLPMLVEFQRLVRLEVARRTARVETATPLSADLSMAIQARLEAAYGPGLNVAFVQNPPLLGGMCITVGSDIYDGSVRGRLAALEERL